MKMILLKSLKLHNFLSHKDTVLDFSPTEKTLIDGLSGAGKSAIVDAIVWCLYGESRVNPRSLIRKGAKSVKVSLELTTQEFGLVNIDRAFQGATQKLQIFIHDGEKYVPSPITGIRPSQEWIEKKLIGASYTLFVNSVAYLQDGGKLFASLPANERRDLLLEIIKAEDYDAQHEAAKKKLQQYEIETAGLQSTILANQASLDRMTAVGEDKQSLTDAKKVLEKELKQHEKDLAAAQALEAAHHELRVKQAKLQADLSSEENSLERIKKHLRDREEFAGKEKAIQAELADIHTQLQKLTTEKESLTTDIASLKAQTAAEMKTYEDFFMHKPSTADLAALQKNEQRLKEEMSTHATKPVCPSGERCPYMSGSKSLVELVAEYADATAAVYNKEQEIKKWDEELNTRAWFPTRDKLEKAEWQVSSIDVAVSALHKKERELHLSLPKPSDDVSPADLLVAEASVADLQRQIKELEEEDGKYNGRLFIPSIQEKISRTHLSIGELTSRLTAVQRHEETVKELKESVDKATARLKEIGDNITKVELVKDAFGPKGIKTMVIDFLIPKLEEEVNEILSRLSDFTVRFDTQAEKTDGGMKEGLFITIINDVGEELPFEAFSGGEKLKITVAISEALASLQKAKFRLFDEMFIGLDETSTESFAMVLERLQEDFPQVLCISHLRQIKDMFTRAIMVTKHGGISTIHV